MQSSRSAMQQIEHYMWQSHLKFPEKRFGFAKTQFDVLCYLNCIRTYNNFESWELSYTKDHNT